MPYSQSQNRLFWAAASNPAIAKEHGLTEAKAKTLAEEGVKKKGKPVLDENITKKLAKALMTK